MRAPFLVQTQRESSQNRGGQVKLGHPLRARVVILDCAKAADRLPNLWEPWVAKRKRARRAVPLELRVRCPPLCPGTRDQHAWGRSGEARKAPPRMAARRRLFTLAGFPGGGSGGCRAGPAQGTTCHHLKGKGFRRTLVPQWISPSSLW